MKYILAPFAGWLAAGGTKFLLAWIRRGRPQIRDIVAYGGFPSIHTSVMSTVTFLAGFTEGFDTPLFAVAMGTFLLLIIDAHGLRRQVGKHGEVLNRMQRELPVSTSATLRERMGHKWIEIAGGLVLGIVVGWIFSRVNF